MQVRKRYWWIVILPYMLWLVSGCRPTVDNTVCLVPRVDGLSLAQAQAKLNQVGLTVIEEYDSSLFVATGVVLSQSPSAGTVLEPCAGTVTIVVNDANQQAAVIPTVDVTNAVVQAQPTPTADLPASSTQAPPLPPPTQSPAVAPTVEPRIFWDDFEQGIRPEWGFIGNTFTAVNGRLAVGPDGWVESSVVGDPSWQNYRLFLYNLWPGNVNDNNRTFEGEADVRVFVRAIDSNNALGLFCFSKRVYANVSCEWSRLRNGEREVISGTKFDFSAYREGVTVEINVRDNIIEIFLDGQSAIRFADDTFPTGGVMLQIIGAGRLDGVDVFPLPSSSTSGQNSQLTSAQPTKSSLAQSNNTAVINCPGAWDSRLSIGDTAVVIPERLVMRSGPGTRYDPVRGHSLSQNRQIFILNGPVCDGGMLWWEAETGVITLSNGERHNMQGWVAEESGDEWMLRPSS